MPREGTRMSGFTPWAHGLATETEDYTCGICGGQFRRGATVRIRCAVLHRPGECCHYGEEELAMSAEDGA